MLVLKRRWVGRKNDLTRIIEPAVLILKHIWVKPN